MLLIRSIIKINIIIYNSTILFETIGLYRNGYLRFHPVDRAIVLDYLYFVTYFVTGGSTSNFLIKFVSLNFLTKYHLI